MKIKKTPQLSGALGWAKRGGYYVRIEANPYEKRNAFKKVLVEMENGLQMWETTSTHKRSGAMEVASSY